MKESTQSNILHRVLNSMERFKSEESDIHAKKMRDDLYNLVMVYHTDHSPLKISEYYNYINKNWK